MNMHLSDTSTEMFLDVGISPGTLVQLLRSRAATYPDQLAYTFLLDGELDTAQISYAQLDARAQAIAATLQRQFPVGARALLLYPPGLEYIAAFFGCLYAGLIAVPAYPPNPAKIQRTLPRLLTIVADASPAVALTTAEILPMAEAMAALAPDFQRLPWLATDTPADLLKTWQAPAIDTHSLAMLQYTSGSTAAPKGVMLSHANLLHNLAQIYSCFGHSSASKGVIWLPPYHDMGLIGGILQPLYGAFPVTLMSPVAFLQRPLRWLEAISREQATTSGGPNFAYDLCARKVTPEQKQTLDLSSWRVAFNGAEPIRAESIERFADAFASCGFRKQAFLPCYGLAEATLIVSGKPHQAEPLARLFSGAALLHNRALLAEADEEAARLLVGCGQVVGEQQLAIVRPEDRTVCAEGQIGEVWVSGRSVAQGYWGKSELTEQSFRARLTDGAHAPFLRTGDLGFVQDGELFITGRLKDLLIIRGRNHYPHDIELTVERCHAALRPGGGAAFTVELEGEERLIIAQEVERQHRNVEVEELAAAIRAAVAEQHELHVYGVVLLKTGAMPKTSSGKLQRHACRAEYLAGTLNVVGSSLLEEAGTDAGELAQPTRAELLAAAPHTRHSLLERAVVAEVARALRVAPSSVRLDLPLTGLGLDSLMAIELQHSLEAGLGIVLPMTSFLEGLSIAQLANEAVGQLSAAGDRQHVAPLVARGAQAEYPLSYGQRALWFLNQLAPESAAYNVAGAVRIRSALDVGALRRAFEQLVERHSSLRTTFELRAGEPVQRIHAQAELYFEVEQAALWSEAELERQLAEAAHQPFDLERGPLLRVHLFARAAEEHVLLLVIHHIVSDLWSLATLVAELGRLYPAERAGQALALDPLPIGYGDYVLWQAERLAGWQGERDWAYWQQALAGAVAVLNLPTDHPRPPVQGYQGKSQQFVLSAELTRALKAHAQERGATLYMVLLAAFQALLYRYTGQEDLVVGSPTAGRQQAELGGLVGYFVNPIAVRARFTAETSFDALVEQVKATLLGAFEHAEYPLALLIEKLQLARDPSRSPLFQVMFILQKAPALGDGGLEALALGNPGTRLELGGLELETLTLEQRMAQFDLTLTMGEAEGRLVGTMEYNSELFEVATIARLMARFQYLLAGLLGEPGQAIAGLPLLTGAEQQQYAAWNDTWAAELEAVTLVELFERQVELTPEAVAVLLPQLEAPDAAAATTNHHTGRASLTYRELNQQANQLAHHLRKRGVGPEVYVALCMERSLELIIAIIGILKAGGAYVPLDPDYPAERLAFIVRETRATSLLTQERLLDVMSRLPLSNDELPRICLDCDWEHVADESTFNPEHVASPEQLACVIYTSGSTGQPKGVLLEHRNLINLVQSFIRSYEPGPADRILPLTAIASASFVGEVLPILCSGGALVLPDKDEFLDFQKLIAVIAREQVTILSTVPALLAGINALSSELKLRLLLSGGEALFSNQVDQLLDSATVVNGYGLTETTICSTYYILQASDLASDAPIPIGKPLINNQIYVLDKNMQRVPIGVSGELYIAGEGLARGYLNNPAATAERFVPNPFVSEGLEMREWTLRYARGSGLGSAGEPTSNLQSLISNSDRLYRTGDLARYRPDGQIEFHGRDDHQVKIRGFRIELGEIEICLGHHPAVAEAVVLAQDLGGTGGNGTAPQDKRLVAYVVPSPSSVVNSRLSHIHDGSSINKQPAADHAQLITDLRAFVQARLPDYMVPSAFVILSALPLTPNGKVDVRALPLPDSARPALAAAYVAPQSEVERSITAVWQEVLGLEKVGVHDNFFELGGHSLLLVKAHARLRTAFDRPLSLVDLFQYPTVSSLAQYLSQEQEAAPVFEKVQVWAEKQQQARGRRQQRMRNAVRRGDNTDE